MLLDLAPESVCQGELFEQNDSVDSGIISKTLDVINARFGRGAIQLGSSSIEKCEARLGGDARASQSAIHDPMGRLTDRKSVAMRG
jgi:hypothetical protein